MSNSVRPHRLQPTRPRRPQDSPGKNIGVGCHFLLQCMKVKSESEVTQSCPTLSDPMDCSLPDSFIHGIFQARVLEWVAIAFSMRIAWWCENSTRCDWWPNLNHILWTISNAPQVGSLCYNFLEGQGLCGLVYNTHPRVESLK